MSADDIDKKKKATSSRESLNDAESQINVLELDGRSTNGDQDVELDVDAYLDQFENAIPAEGGNMQYLQVSATVEKMVDVGEHEARQAWRDSSLRTLPKYNPRAAAGVDNAFAKKRESVDEGVEGMERRGSTISMSSNTPFKVIGQDQGMTHDTSYIGSQVFGERSGLNHEFSNNEPDNSQSDLFCFEKTV